MSGAKRMGWGRAYGALALAFLCCPALLAGQARLDSTRTTAATPEIVSLYYTTPGDTVRKTDTLRDTLRLYCHVKPCPPFSRDSLPSGGGGTPVVGIPVGAFATPGGAPPAGLTMTVGAYSPDVTLARITAARGRYQILMQLTAGAERNLTAGRFDFAKWRARVDAYDTPAIAKAIAGGVADGTIIGNVVMDEPENPKNGGNLTKALVDSMCAYMRETFPTLPCGVTHKHKVFEPSIDYAIVGFLVSQYRASDGDVAAFRDAGLAFARRSGISIVFSVNVIDGGTQGDSWGQGTKPTLYNMSPALLKRTSLTLGPAGCALTMWEFRDEYWQKSGIAPAITEVGLTLATLPRKGCTRP